MEQTGGEVVEAGTLMTVKRHRIGGIKEEDSGTFSDEGVCITILWEHYSVV